MSTPDNGYAVQSQTHVNKYDPASGNVVPGYDIRVRDNETGTVFPVFVPDDYYGPDQAQTLIEHELAKVRAVHSLGS